MSRQNYRVGLLGGSFNPAHEGHVNISEQALKRLRLNRVWWVITPQNPMKLLTEMSPLKERIEIARNLTRKKPRILVTEIEDLINTKYTADTLKHIIKQYPKFKFIWLMGADNLSQISEWERWASILYTMPVAVFARPTYSLKALNSVAANIFADQRISAQKAINLVNMKPPTWTFLLVPQKNLSATQIRQGVWSKR